MALTQAGQIKKLLEDQTGYKFEFKIIKTQGDQITNKPLWQLEGKDFFTKELDSALMSKQVDLVIHSYKDLGSDRPDDIHLSAITKRQYPQDILLISEKTIENLKDWPERDFIVGTSAPRRIVNIESSLKDFLPYGNTLSLKCKTLRGNVNSRIEKLNQGEYDAIVLAFAGLERLAITEESSKILKNLLKGLQFKILPLSHFPPAASQGALAIETYRENKELQEILKSAHCEQTAKAIAKERQVFQSYGGGCHLALGIHIVPWKEKFLQFQKGEVDGKKIHKRTMLPSLDMGKIEKPKRENLFLGFPSLEVETVLLDELSKKEPILSNRVLEQAFVTSSYCFDTLSKLTPEGIWAAGEGTHKKLAAIGHWVLGDSDSLGMHRITDYLNSKLIQIFLNNKTKLTSLTEIRGTALKGVEVLPAYQRTYRSASEDFLCRLKKCTHFYWTSYPQFEHYNSLLPQVKRGKHYCGLGKTYDKFTDKKIPVTPLLSFKELLHE